jgi:uncharacterized protein YktB (UPF0637 family)
MSGNERRRDGYERLTNDFERFLNKNRTVQERLTDKYHLAHDRYEKTQDHVKDGYRTVVDRVKNKYDQLTNRRVPEDKEKLMKDDRKYDK